jgi:outer membrane protein TolC
MMQAAGRRIARGMIWAIAFAAGAGAKTWSLDQLLEQGFKTAPAIQEARAEMDKAEASVNVALGAFFPRLSATGRARYWPERFSPLGSPSVALPSAAMFLDDNAAPSQADRTLALYVDTALGGIRDALVDPAPYTLSFGLELRQPIFAQGKLRTGLLIEKTRQRSLLCKYQSAQETVKAAITRAFYRALLAGENVAVQDQAVALARESHRLTVDRFAAGAASELDTLHSRMRVDEAELGAQDAGSARTVAYETLVSVAGAPEPPEAVALDGHIPDSDFSISLPAALERMHEDNKQLGKMQSAGQIRDYAVRMNRQEYFPSVSAGASATAVSLFDAGESLHWQEDYRLWLGLEWNFFAGMTKVYRIRESVAEKRAFEQRRRERVEQLELAVKRTWHELQNARKRLEQTRSLVSMARKRYAMAKKAYEVGQQRLVDFQSSELALNRARLGLNQARFQFYSTVVDMRVLIGDYLYEEQAQRQ